MNKRFRPVHVGDLGIDSEVYKWTIWDNETDTDLYFDEVFRTKKDAQKACDLMNR